VLASISKIMVFQNIASEAHPEARRYWQEVKATYPNQTMEFVDQYDELAPKTYFGLGVLLNPMYYVCALRPAAAISPDGTSMFGTNGTLLSNEEVVADTLECFHAER